METKQAARQEAIEKMKQWVKPGDTVYTILRHVSGSGMTRHIGVVVMVDGDPIHPNYIAAKAIEARLNKRGDGVVMGGCGMDMGFQLVYLLGQALYPDGFPCTGDKCPSNDHSNGDRNYQPHLHKSGGYALRQRWL